MVNEGYVQEDCCIRVLGGLQVITEYKCTSVQVNFHNSTYSPDQSCTVEYILGLSTKSNKFPSDPEN